MWYSDTVRSADEECWFSSGEQVRLTVSFLTSTDDIYEKSDGQRQVIVA